MIVTSEIANEAMRTIPIDNSVLENQVVCEVPHLIQAEDATRSLCGTCCKNRLCGEKGPMVFEDSVETTGPTLTCGSSKGLVNSMWNIPFFAIIEP